MKRAGRGRSQKTLDLIAAAIRILERIQPASVRAVCYQLFIEELIPTMEKVHTNRVSFLLARAREAGELSWDWVVDETREAERVSTWQDVAEFGDDVKRAYRRDYWQMQQERVEVWSEKGTVRGTLEPVLAEYGVTFRVMHGHASATAVMDAARETQESSKTLTILYVGDWDPSGMDMSERDLPRRLKKYGANVRIERVAIARQDTKRKPRLPGFSAKDKASDTRAPWFIKKYGTQCFELDALDPTILRTRIRDEIDSRIEHEAWAHQVHVEAMERESMNRVLSALQSIRGQARE